jgi:hypothetical protein
MGVADQTMQLLSRTAASVRPRSTHRNPSTIALWALVGVVLLLLISTTWHWYINTKWPSPANLLFTALGSLFAGGLLGFLFGVPRVLQQSAPAADSGNGQSRTRSFEPNTNLERISEWLTTMIIGLGLTHLSQLWVRFVELSTAVAASFGGSPVAGGSIVIVFSVSGFLFVYLWTRSYLSISDALREMRIAKLELDQREYALADFTRQNHVVTIAEEVKSNRPQMKPAMSNALLQRTKGTEPDDPWKKRFGEQAERNGRRLSAKVVEIPGSQFYKVTIRVESTDKTRPLNGKVALFLHDSFAPYDRLLVDVVNDVAEYEVRSYGAFTVGALTDEGQTELELDLAELPDAPARFRQL